MTYTDEELENIFKELIQWRGQGVSERRCAALVGISRDTLRRWLKKGESKRSKFHKFKIEYEKAYANWKAYHFVEANKKASTFQDHWKIATAGEEEYSETHKINATIENKKSKSMDEIIESINKDLEIMREEKNENLKG